MFNCAQGSSRSGAGTGSTASGWEARESATKTLYRRTWSSHIFAWNAAAYRILRSWSHRPARCYRPWGCEVMDSVNVHNSRAPVADCTAHAGPANKVRCAKIGPSGAGAQTGLDRWRASQTFFACASCSNHSWHPQANPIPPLHIFICRSTFEGHLLAWLFYRFPHPTRITTGSRRVYNGTASCCRCPGEEDVLTKGRHRRPRLQSIAHTSYRSQKEGRDQERVNH